MGYLSLKYYRILALFTFNQQPW